MCACRSSYASVNNIATVRAASAFASQQRGIIHRGILGACAAVSRLGKSTSRNVSDPSDVAVSQQAPVMRVALNRIRSDRPERCARISRGPRSGVRLSSACRRHHTMLLCVPCAIAMHRRELPRSYSNLVRSARWAPAGASSRLGGLRKKTKELSTTRNVCCQVRRSYAPGPKICARASHFVHVNRRPTRDCARPCTGQHVHTGHYVDVNVLLNAVAAPQRRILGDSRCMLLRLTYRTRGSRNATTRRCISFRPHSSVRRAARSNRSSRADLSNTLALSGLLTTLPCVHADPVNCQPKLRQTSCYEL